MSTIRYGFFGEDNAQELFLKHYLVALASGQPWHFEQDATFPLKGGNKSRVKALFDEAYELGMSQAYRHDCFFIGLDLDDHDDEALHATVREMHKKLGTTDKTAILLIPVQCIEHWLWHLKWKQEHAGSTKNISLETQPRPEAKQAVYNARKCSTKHSNPIVEHLAAGMDIDWLVSRSVSFRAFHGRVLEYIRS
jgi:hypothetical protein